MVYSDILALAIVKNFHYIIHNQIVSTILERMQKSSLKGASQPLYCVKHNHSKCIELAGDIQRPASAKESRQLQERPWKNNVLMYVRKSDDVEQILDAIKDSVLFIKNKQMPTSASNKMAKQRRQYIYMERWALDALETHMSQTGLTLEVLPSTDERRTLSLPNSQVILKEWNPESESKEL